MQDPLERIVPNKAEEQRDQNTKRMPHEVSTSTQNVNEERRARGPNGAELKANNRNKNAEMAAAIDSNATKAPATRSRHSRSYIAAQQANAAKREREEWDRTRGAGSNVLLRYEEQSAKQASATDENRSPASSSSAAGPGSDMQQARRTAEYTAADVVPPIEEILQRPTQPVEVTGMDRLLDWGLCEYTILPKTLGRGRFSTVYLAMKNGERYAIKHTPLFPHHELVATRLLREPTLLAEIPPHPNLVSVIETIRTPGHFYLVEEFLDGYVTLEALIGRMNINTPTSSAHKLPHDAAEKIFEQLVLALYAIHKPLRVCHRDVKPENVLVHPETLQLKLLDFGLATHFSRSHAKLTTCCGSPAFHCPEIVTALSKPLGSVSYWGPEVDAWTCGVTLLRCLSGIRYPLGTSHTSPASMGARAKRVLQTLPPSQLLNDVAALLDLNPERRMRYFEQLAERIQSKPEHQHSRHRRELKCTSFVPAPPQHAMVLPLVLTNEAADLASSHDERLPIGPDFSMITLLNTSLQPSRRVLSFIKYCLRCAGILYHTLAVAGKYDEPGTMRVPTKAVPKSEAVRACAFQCVIELLQDEEPGTLAQVMQTIKSLFGQRTTTEELVKLPARAVNPRAKDMSEPPSSGPSGKQGPLRMLVFYMVVAFPSGTETPMFQDLEPPAPEVIAAALQNRLAPITKQTSASPRHSIRRQSAEEPSLYIDTRVERLPPAQIVSPSPPARARSHTHSRASSRSRSKAPSARSNAVQVYVSDARALPYVRGALSNGGVLKQESLRRESGKSDSSISRHPHTAVNASDRHPEWQTKDVKTLPTSPASLSSRAKSSSATPEQRSAEIMGPHELDTSLNAIESTCRSLLVRRMTPGRSDTNNEHAHQLYMLVHRLYRRLQVSLQSQHKDALQRQMAECNFRALDVLGPTLALVGPDDAPTSAADIDVPETTNIGSVALAVLELFSSCSSAKEMCLGFQEQMERLSLAWRSREDAPNETDIDAVTMLARDAPMLIQAVLGQLQCLADVLPAIQTRRPRPLLDSVLGLVYPTLYRDVLCEALDMVRERDTHEELATQAAVVLCELMVSLLSHARSVDEAERPDIACVLGDALYELVRFLPLSTSVETLTNDKAAASTSPPVSDHSVQRTETVPLLAQPTLNLDTVSRRVTVWNIVRKTYEQLDADIGTRALGMPDLSRTAVAPLPHPHAQRNFVLFVHQLAYEALMVRVKGRVRDRFRAATQRSSTIPSPQRWSAELARELCHRFASVLPSTLVPGLSPLDVPSPPRTMACMQDWFLCDAIVTFLRWIVEALPSETRPRVVLDDDSITYSARALAMVATHCTHARLRQWAFEVVTRFVRDASSDDVTLRLVREFMSPTTPPPLRGASVHLVRDIVSRRLERLEKAQVQTDGLVSDGRLWRVWNDGLFVMPKARPNPPTDATTRSDTKMTELATYLHQYQTYLQECCSLFYYVAVRDAAHNYTGFRDEREYTRLYERFVQPLKQWTLAWQSYIAQHIPDDVTAMNLALLAMAIARIEGSQQRH